MEEREILLQGRLLRDIIIENGERKGCSEMVN